MIRKIDRELRLPKLTGTADQCDQAEKIRSRFTGKARNECHDDEEFDLVIKLFRYEAHALFWIGVKESSLEEVISKIIQKNPSVKQLVEYS